MRMLKLQTWTLCASLGVLASFSAFALPSPHPFLAPNEMAVRGQGNHYLTKGSDQTFSDERTGNWAVGFRGNRIFRGPELEAAIDGDVMVGLRKRNYRYFNIREFRVSDHREEIRGHFGRKLHAWNELDTWWSLGMFQPRFRWDYLEEVENGLFGAFLELKNGPWNLLGFVTAVSIPEQGAPFELTNNGDCNTTSPWFSCPNSQISLFNQPTRVKFRLDTPNVGTLINNEGFGFVAAFDRGTGVFGRLAYNWKPMNQLLLAYEGRLDLSTLDLPAVLHPRVLYHHLIGFDLGAKSSNGFKLATSVMREIPERDITPPHWNTQEAEKAWLWGATVGHDLIGRGRTATRLEASWFHREGGNAPDAGPFVTPGASVFEPRFAFQNAWSVLVKSPLLADWAQWFQTQWRVVVDTRANGNILMADFNFRPQPKWRFNLGVDVLGSSSTDVVDFISRYQRNDRVRGGVEYVF